MTTRGKDRWRLTMERSTDNTKKFAICEVRECKASKGLTKREKPLGHLPAGITKSETKRETSRETIMEVTSAKHSKV